MEYVFTVQREPPKSNHHEVLVLPIQLHVVPIQLHVVPIQLHVIPIQLHVVPMQLLVSPIQLKGTTSTRENISTNDQNQYENPLRDATTVAISVEETRNEDRQRNERQQKTFTTRYYHSLPCLCGPFARHV